MQNCGMATSFVTWAESLSSQKDRIWVKTFFYVWSSCNFGLKNRTNIEWRPFVFFGLHLILGRKRTDSEWRNFFWSSLFSNFLPPPPPPFENPAYATGCRAPFRVHFVGLFLCYAALNSHEQQSLAQANSCLFVSNVEDFHLIPVDIQILCSKRKRDFKKIYILNDQVCFELHGLDTTQS